MDSPPVSSQTYPASFDADFLRIAKVPFLGAMERIEKRRKNIFGLLGVSPTAILEEFSHERGGHPEKNGPPGP